MLVTLSYACVGYFQYMFFYWVDYYFEKVLNLPTTISQNYAAIPPLAMAVGMPLGGWLSDRIEHAGGHRVVARSFPWQASQPVLCCFSWGCKLESPRGL